MKKIFFVLATAFILLFTPSFSSAVYDPEKVEFVLFHSTTCPHCQAEIEFIDSKLRPKYGDKVEFKLYEISDPANQAIFSQYSYFYKANVGGVPVTFIDGEVIYGYGNDKTTGQKIMSVIESKLIAKGLLDPANQTDFASSTGDIINIPVLGNVDIKAFSLPILTLVIGLLDGFNPCAMWVLLFLISLLLGIEDRKRMWLLGGLFILASGLVYFLFMAAWLQFLMFVGMIFAVRIVIGLVATGVGGKNLWDWWKMRKNEGVVCKVSKQTNTQKTFAKIKDIVYRKSLWWSILGIIILGFSVNLVELACSAGFPAIFTQVLSMSGLPAWQKYLYMFGYIVFYMLDDMVVFILAMVTLKSKTVGSKYAKYSNLIGGALIFILGILLIFKPGWLMFTN